MKYLRDIPSWRSSWSTRCDGRTAFELHAGRPYRRQLVEFGERVYFMPIRPGGARQAKLDPKWQDAAFIDIRDRSDEMLIMTPSGVYKTRNVRRRPELERWDFEFLTTLKGTPWNPNPAAGEMAADALPADMAASMPTHAPVPQVVVAAAAPVDRAASRLYIRRSDVQKYGYMICPGCRSVMTGTTARAHTEECRGRLENCPTKVGWRVESNQLRNREVVTQCHTRRVVWRAAWHRRLQQVAQRQRLHHAVRQQLNDSKVMKFRIMVSRE